MKVSGVLLTVGIFVYCACFFIGLSDLPLAKSQSLLFEILCSKTLHFAISASKFTCVAGERLLRFWLLYNLSDAQIQEQPSTTTTTTTTAVFQESVATAEQPSVDVNHLIERYCA